MKKKLLFPGVFLFLSLAFSSVSFAQAAKEVNAEALLFMEIPMVIGVSKVAEDYKHVPMSVYVVTQEELKRWGVRQLYELFQRVPGYSFYNTDYYGQYGPIGRGLQSIWRYGYSFELMNVVDFGHTTFVPAWFKTVEIARGPAGLAWGSGAEAGLLNFNVRDDLNGGEVGVEYGNYGRKVLDLMYGKEFEKAGDGYFVGYHTEHQGYQKQYSDYGGATNKLWKMNGENQPYTLLAKIQDKQFKAMFYMDHTDHIGPTLWFGDPGLQEHLESYQANMHDQLEVLAYRLEYHLPIELDNFKAYFYHDYYKKQWWTEGAALDTQRKRTVGFSTETKIADKVGINFGGDLWGQNQITAPSFTAENAEPWGITWYDSNYSPQKFDFRNLYLQGDFTPIEKLKFILGGRWDYQKNDTPRENIFSGPRIGLMYDVTDTTTVKYMYNSTKRRPQANEVSPGVGAEQLGAHELGVIANVTDKVCVDATAFTQKLMDEITRVNNPALLNSFYNTGGITTNGLEWSVKYAPVSKALVYWNGSYQQSKVNSKDINGVTLAEDHNSSDEPLFVPQFTSFLGSEASVMELLKANIALRSIVAIPYRDFAGHYAKSTVHFIDLTLRSNKFWNNKMDVSFVCLNVLDSGKKVPAFGEHAGNSNGTLIPEGRRFYARTTVNF